MPNGSWKSAPSPVTAPCPWPAHSPRTAAWSPATSTRNGSSSRNPTGPGPAVADRIEPRIGDAGTTLDELAAEDPFDLVFIDADKANYPKYYEKSADLLRPGGLIVLDNTLFLGRVIDPSATDPDTNGIREANHLIREDDRMDICVLPLSDGVTLARRKTF